MLNLERGDSVLIHYKTIGHTKLATFLERDNEGNNHFIEYNPKGDVPFCFSDKFISSGKVVIEKLEDD